MSFKYIMKLTRFLLVSFSVFNIFISVIDAQKIIQNNLKFLEEDSSYIGKNNTEISFEKKNNDFKEKKIQEITKIINSLFTKISKTQSQKDVSFRNFPPKMAEIKGLYSSFIHLNFIDNENSFLGKISRNKLAALDMNNFVTNFVLCSLIEALPFDDEFNNETKLSQFKNSISIALEGLSQFRDKNYAENIPIYNFWKQENVNGTWAQAPETMLNLIKSAPHIPSSFIKFLKKINLGNLAGFLETFEGMTQIFMYAFRIPPDVDDSSVNMALTGMLYKMQNISIFNSQYYSNEQIKITKKDNFGNENVTKKKQKIELIESNKEENLNDPNLSRLVKIVQEAFNLKNFNLHDKEKIVKDNFDDKLGNWFSNNSDYESFFKNVKKRAYRPFLNANFTKEIYTKQAINYSEISESADLIDTRTYFVIRKFLAEKFEKKEDLILPSTWIHDIPDEIREFPLVTMPFRVNNIDFNVITNFLFGATNLALFHPDKDYVLRIFDREMQNMYRDTVEIIIFAIKEDIFNWRPDLALLYYPSIFDFYWLISRVYSTLKNAPVELQNLHSFTKGSNNQQEDGIYELFLKVQYSLEYLLKTELTEQMIKRLSKSENNDYYFVEFLGNTENLKRNEDSLFATALGLNAFLNIWTKEISGKNLKNIINFSIKKNIIYDLGIPQNVKDIIESLANYLINNVNKRSASYECAFFSGSVKSESNNEYFFPGNYFKFLNGTELNDHTKAENVGFTLTSGMKGFVNEAEYQELLKDTYFGLKPPIDFKPYNLNIFPYWSSPAMTLSVNYLALTKYRSLIQE